MIANITCKTVSIIAKAILDHFNEYHGVATTIAYDDMMLKTSPSEILACAVDSGFIANEDVNGIQWLREHLEYAMFKSISYKSPFVKCRIQELEEKLGL